MKKRKLNKTFFDITFKFKKKFLFIPYTKKVKLEYYEATVNESLDFLEIIEQNGK